MIGSIELIQTGIYSFQNISVESGGSWYAKEIVAPEGYNIVNTAWQRMNTSDGGTTWELTVTNEIKNKNNIKIIKKDTNGNPLKGAIFIFKYVRDGQAQFLYYDLNEETRKFSKWVQDGKGSTEYAEIQNSIIQQYYNNMDTTTVDEWKYKTNSKRRIFI